MQNLSLIPMKFGSQEDFKSAITELKWITKTFGKASSRNFDEVSAKYNFPVDFLKAGMEGFGIKGDDYRISSGNWFPIIFSWDSQKKETTDELFGLHIDFLSSRFFLALTIISLAGMFQALVLLLRNYLILDSLNTTLLAISFALFIIGLFTQMWESVSAKKRALEKCRHNLKQKGLESIVEEDNNFVRNYHKYIIYVPGIMKKKLEEAIPVSVFSSSVKDGKLIPTDYEWPLEEYKKRIAQLAVQGT